MSKGNAFSFWQKREEAEVSQRARYTRSSSTASEFFHLRQSKGKNISSPLTRREESIEDKPEVQKKSTPNVNFATQIKEEPKPDFGVEENGSPVLRRPKKETHPTPAPEEEEEELRKFVRKSIRRIKRETRVFSQDFPSAQPSSIPELDPVEVDEEEVEEMLPLVKDLLAGNQPVSSEEEDEAESDPEKLDHADKDKTEDPQVEKEDAGDNQGTEHNLESLIKELENADDLDPDLLKDILKRSLSALKTMVEKVESLESQLKGQQASSSPVSVVPSGPPPPPPPAPPPSLMAGPKPLVIKKRQGTGQAEKIAGPPQVASNALVLYDTLCGQVDMMAEMRKMMARRNERKSLRMKYTHLEK